MHFLHRQSLPFFVPLNNGVILLKVKLFSLISIIILLGGCFVNQEEEQTVNKAKSTVESYLNNNFEDIKEINFDKKDFEIPMGGLFFPGVDNEKIKFSINFIR